MQTENARIALLEFGGGMYLDDLTAYLAERAAGQVLSVNVNSLHRRNARRRNESNQRYRPHRWRG